MSISFDHLTLNYELLTAGELRHLLTTALLCECMYYICVIQPTGCQKSNKLMWICEYVNICSHIVVNFRLYGCFRFLVVLDRQTDVRTDRLDRPADRLGAIHNSYRGSHKTFTAYKALCNVLIQFQCNSALTKIRLRRSVIEMDFCIPQSAYCFQYNMQRTSFTYL